MTRSRPPAEYKGVSGSKCQIQCGRVLGEEEDRTIGESSSLVADIGSKDGISLDLTIKEEQRGKAHDAIIEGINDANYVLQGIGSQEGKLNTNHIVSFTPNSPS